MKQEQDKKFKKNIEKFFINGIAPKIASVLIRKLKPGQTYEDFRKEWLPQEPYYGSPVFVVNAQNIYDPTEIITIGLVWTDDKAADTDDMSIYQQKIVEWGQKYGEQDAQRGDKIDQVTDDVRPPHVYKILDLDNMGK